jgi:phosphate transport system substrate-binding protein
MKKNFKYIVVAFVLIVVVIFACSKKKEQKETIISGSISILVDESLTPIIEDQVAVFENTYDAKVKLISQSEKEAIVSLSNGVSEVIILPRKLTVNEERLFSSKKINPKTTPFARDAIAFIANKKSNDTLITVDEMIHFLKGANNKIKGLVFDNPNSSSAKYMLQLAGINELPLENVFSFKTNEEVIKYVASNEGMIGVVGVNWIFQPSPKMVETVAKVNVLSVKSKSSTKYFFPSQENIATGDYPLARDLYIINCQGYGGLGMGFASFISGEIGQRIILKSGLAPVRVPSRNIRIKNN